MARRGQDGSTVEAASGRPGAKPRGGAGAAPSRTPKTPEKIPRKPGAPPPPAAGIGARSDVTAAQATFAANLVRFRKAAGLTQDQLAERSGISQAQISQLERGTWEPRLGTFIALARALGVAAAEFLPRGKED